jgi:uncharacterized protein
MLAGSFFEDVWESVHSLEWARPILASTESLNLSESREVWLQGEGDLGKKLENILRRALKQSPAALALGADSPGLPIRLLENAREALAKSDVVLGPCEDGGFYLLGLKNCPAELLSGIRWSQPDTFGQTMSRLRQAGLSISVLEHWFDVDTPDDLKLLRSLIEAKVILAPHTAEVFARSHVAQPWTAKAFLRIQTTPRRWLRLIMNAGTRFWDDFEDSDHFWIQGFGWLAQSCAARARETAA